MADDPIATYQEARKNFKSATKDVEDMVNFLRVNVARLDHWKSIIIANVDSDADPVDLQSAGKIDGGKWPDARRLHDAIAKWHEVELTMKDAYRKIPENQRDVVKSPMDAT